VFGNPTVYLEKFIVNPRHVEVQIMADKHGKVLHFYERDCSTQRRHQKVIEESPCPVLRQEERKELCDSAIRLIKAADYHNAATVEFLLDKDNNFYFIEVNTRIQVEHPVTELVTNHDLIELQIKSASGEKFKLQQKDIQLNGAAMECRINAEDPARDFAPCPGRIEKFIPPGGPGVRIDTHVYQGYTVPSNYDSMVCKLLVYRKNRKEVITTMKRSLDEFTIEPIKTTIPLCRQIISHNRFEKSEIDTGFVERQL
jgi:acetyl-CoA carboxylase biotin carboxylase subunit